jgi:hypothetical protein
MDYAYGPPHGWSLDESVEQRIDEYLREHRPTGGESLEDRIEAAQYAVEEEKIRRRIEDEKAQSKGRGWDSLREV